MKALPLTLVKKSGPSREAVAWYLAEHTPEEWLEALGRWSGVQDELQLYIVPRGVDCQEPGGLLVIPPVGARPPEGWRGLALGVVENRLFFPVDAELFPPVGTAEVRALCRAQVTFFHPGVGVVEFTDADCRRVWDLLQPAPLISANWNAARSEPPLSSTLHGVALEALPEEGDIFGDAAEEIGTEPPKKLPRRRREPSAGPISQLGRTVAGLGAGAVARMMSWFSGGGSREALRRGQISLLHDAKGGSGPVFVLTAPNLVRNTAVLPATDRFIQPLTLTVPDWLPDAVAAMAVSAGHAWILRNSNGEWIVDIRTSKGHLSGDFSLQSLVDEIPEPITSVAMLAVRSQVWIALGRYLFQFEKPRHPSRRWICETPIIALEPTAPLLSAGVVARCEQGVAIFWCDHLKDVGMLATDLAAPFSASLGNGMTVFLSSRAGPDGFAGRVVDVDRHGVHSEQTFLWRGAWPAGLVAMPQPDAFAIFDQDGSVQAYQVPTVD